MRKQVLGRSQSTPPQMVPRVEQEPCLLWTGWMPACVCVCPLRLSGNGHTQHVPTFISGTLLSFLLQPDLELAKPDPPTACQLYYGNLRGWAEAGSGAQLPHRHSGRSQPAGLGQGSSHLGDGFEAKRQEWGGGWCKAQPVGLGPLLGLTREQAGAQ